jgi:ADP-heptose:LPS heptosyltransferase
MSSRVVGRSVVAHLARRDVVGEGSAGGGLWRRGMGVRVLLCRPDHLGDVLFALPAVALLRAALPDAHLTLAVAPGMADLVARCPHLDDVLALPFPAVNASAAPPRWVDAVHALAPRMTGRYDVALLVRPDDPWSGALVRSARVPVRMGLDQPRTVPFLTHVLREPAGQHVSRLGLSLATAALARLGHGTAPPVPPEPCLDLTRGDHVEADAVLTAGGVDAAPVVLHPGSGWPLKNWPPARWGKLAAALRDRRGITPLVLGSPDEADIVAAVVDAAAGAAVAGTRLSLPGLAALHTRARLVITTDSGAAHLAATMGAAVVALFGPGDPVVYRPPAPPTRLRVVRLGLACSPCGTLEHPPCGAVRDPACVTGISLAMVLAAADDLLGERSRAPSYATG